MSALHLKTTLAGRRYAQLIPRWQAAGYRVHLIFLRLANEEVAIERVAVRVSQGGHSVSRGGNSSSLQEGCSELRKNVPWACRLVADIRQFWRALTAYWRGNETMKRKAAQKNDGKLLGVEAALRRASRRARERAAQTDTPLVIYSEGKIKKLKIKPKASHRAA